MYSHQLHEYTYKPKLIAIKSVHLGNFPVYSEVHEARVYRKFPPSSFPLNTYLFKLGF